MTAADFDQYDAIVLGDPVCSSLSPLTAAITNAATWGPMVDGNVIVIGTDEEFHRSQGGQSLMNGAAKFAVAAGGKTGAYISLSCAYHDVALSTPIPWLGSAFGGTWQIRGVGCFNDAHIVTTHPALAEATDARLSNWSCSVHEAFQKWPSNFDVLAIARNIGSSYVAPDRSIGTPYILARGAGTSSGDTRERRAILYVGGITSSGSCFDRNGDGYDDGIRAEAPRWLAPYLASNTAVTSRVIVVKHAFFSYSGQYCSGDGGNGESPEYTQDDTCERRFDDDQVARFSRLIDQLTITPRTRVTIVAHSQGGLLTAYAVSKLGADQRQKIASVVTLDSFPGGLPEVEVRASEFLFGSELKCGAWRSFPWNPAVTQDWVNSFPVAKSAMGAAGTYPFKSGSYRVPFYTLNATGPGPLARETHIEGERFSDDVPETHSSIWGDPGVRTKQDIACAVTDGPVDETGRVVLSRTCSPIIPVIVLPSGVATHPIVLRPSVARWDLSATVGSGTRLSPLLAERGADGAAISSSPLTTSASTIRLTLVDPTGRRLDRLSLPLGVTHNVGDGFDAYELTDPIAGTWTIELFGLDVPPTGEVVEVWSNTLGVALNQSPAITVPAGQITRSGESAGFTVTATDTDADDTLALTATGLPAALTFIDNGDRTGTVSGTVLAPPGTYTASFSVSDGHNSAVTATVEIVVRSNGPDLRVTQELTPGRPALRAGGTLSYLLHVRNVGNQATPPPPNTVTIIDTPPASTSIASWSLITGTGNCSLDGVGRLVCGLGGGWGPGSETVVEVVIRTPKGGLITNAVEVDPFKRIAESNEDNNRITLETMVPPPGPGVNLLRNGSFESGSSDWSFQTDNPAHPLVLQGARYRTGIRALEFPPMPAPPPFVARVAESGMVSIVPSGTYLFSFWAYTADAASMLWDVNFYAADGTRSCTASDGRIAVGGMVTLEGAPPVWRNYTFSVGPFPSCAAKADVAISQGNFLGTNPPTSVYLDDFSFTRTQ